MSNETQEITQEDLHRYARHIALPGFTPAHQARLKAAHIIVVGAGGLGAAALPYLAGAGIGHLTIIDHDTVSETNLHRQTIFQTEQIGQNKAECAANYLKKLNPSIHITAIDQKLSRKDGVTADLLIDGSDNFETKTLLNQISIETQTPLISASVNQFAGQLGIFAGFASDTPCYACLFPELPNDARNCNEAGVMGTAAGITGMYQAHTALCFLLGKESFTPGTIIRFDFESLHMRKLQLQKDATCSVCGDVTETFESLYMMSQEKKFDIALIRPEDLTSDNDQIVDVRTHEEVAESPIQNALHIPLDELALSMEELPKNKRLAFACASNVRSQKAAEYALASGFENVCIYDALAA